MKMRLNFTVALVFSLVLASCSDKTEDEKIAPTETSSGELVYYVNGAKTPLEKIDRSLAKHTYITGNKVHMFDTDQTYETFLANCLNTCKNEEKAKYEYEVKTHQLTKKIAQYAADHGLTETDAVPKELQVLLDELGTLKQRYQSKNNLRTNAFSIVIVYEHDNFSGAKVTIGNPQPVLPGFNNKISSFNFLSGQRIRFYDKIFFGGSTIAFDWDAVPSLRAYGWNDRASSIE